MDTIIDSKFSELNVTSNVSEVNSTSIESLVGECAYGAFYKGLSQFGLLFYVHNPYDHFVDNARDVRNYEIWVSNKLSIKVATSF